MLFDVACIVSHFQRRSNGLCTFVFFSADTFDVCGMDGLCIPEVLQFADGRVFDGTPVVVRRLTEADMEDYTRPLFNIDRSETSGLMYGFIHFIKSLNDVDDYSRLINCFSKAAGNGRCIGAFILMGGCLFDKMLRDLLYRFEGNRSYEKLVEKIDAYDRGSFAQLTDEETNYLTFFDRTVKIFANSIHQKFPNFHILIVVSEDVFATIENFRRTSGSNDLDDVNVVDYLRSQLFLYKRLTFLLPKYFFSLLNVDKCLRINDLRICFDRVENFVKSETFKENM